MSLLSDEHRFTQKLGKEKPESGFYFLMCLFPLLPGTDYYTYIYIYISSDFKRRLLVSKVRFLN